MITNIDAPQFPDEWQECLAYMLATRIMDEYGVPQMIPPDRSYRQHMIIWEKETAAQGIGRTHGLRHAYAQRRYLELTGWAAPAVAGIRKLTPDERTKDQEARKIISEELGHGRIAITNAYLGSWKGGK